MEPVSASGGAASARIYSLQAATASACASRQARGSQMLGWAGRVDNNNAKPALCHLSKVSGLTKCSALRQPFAQYAKMTSSDRPTE